jgi:radical SAM protein with 4Fe4S-binding SPASM domain
MVGRELTKGEPMGIENPMRFDVPLKVTLSFTETCNLECKCCYGDCQGKPQPELRNAEWVSIIDHLIDLGVVYLYIEGGEPFYRPDFIELLRRYCRKLFIQVRTNATLITSQLSRELRQIGIGSVLVDVMSTRAETHDYLTGAAGSHAQSCTAVSQLVAAGVDTQMLLILNRHNVAELQDYVEFAYSLGVRSVGILRLYPLGRAKYRWSELSLSLSEMMTAITSLRLPGGMRLMHSWHPNDANSCWQMAAINAYGDSIGCAYLREFVNFGNVLKIPFLDTWDHPLYRELRSGHVEKSCTQCATSQGSHGGCRASAYAFYGRWSAPDPFDAVLNDGVDLRVLPEWLLQARPKPPRPAGA